MMVQALLLLPRLVVTPEFRVQSLFEQERANQLNWPYKPWLPSYVATPSKQRAGSALVVVPRTRMPFSRSR
jgi:hypothetical protein